jgi:hypothetical protein
MEVILKIFSFVIIVGDHPPLQPQLREAGASLYSTFIISIQLKMRKSIITCQELRASIANVSISKLKLLR